MHLHHTYLFRMLVEQSQIQTLDILCKWYLSKYIHKVAPLLGHGYSNIKKISRNEIQSICVSPCLQSFVTRTVNLGKFSISHRILVFLCWIYHSFFLGLDIGRGVTILICNLHRISMIAHFINKLNHRTSEKK